MKNETMNHGLFGKMEPGAIVEFKDWRDIARQVYSNSKQNITMYRAVISFLEETAKELYLDDQKSWQRYIENHIMTIAEKNGIKRENLKWVCAVHGEKRHPHIHAAFWDQSVNARNPYVSPKIPEAIRKQLIKETFSDKIRDYYQKKDQYAKTIREITDSMVTEFEGYLRRLNHGKYSEFQATLSQEMDMFLPEDKMGQLGNRLIQLRRAMPSDGRIVYQLLPQELKEQTDEVVRFMIQELKPVREALQSYIDVRIKMSALYSSNDVYLKSMESRYEKEAQKILGNRILSGVRMLMRLDYEMNSTFYAENRKEIYAEQIIMESLNLLSQIIDGCEESKSNKLTSGDLSKEAKKELYLKYQDKGYEH